MNKKCFFYIFLFLIFSVQIHASLVDWKYEANAGLESDGGYGYCGYALNFPNPVTTANETTYTSCTIPGSLFTPLSFDVSGTSGVSSIITVTSTALNIYSQDCDLESTTTTGCTPTAQPQWVNPTGTATGKLIVACSNYIKVFVYNPSTFGFDITDVVDTTSSYNGIVGIVCPATYDYWGCVLFNTSKSTAKLTLSDLSITVNTGELGDFVTQDLSDGVGISQYRAISGGSVYNTYIPYLQQRKYPTQGDIGVSIVECGIIPGGDCGTLLTNTTGLGIVTGTGNYLDTLHSSNSFIAKLGNSFKIFGYVDGHVTSGGLLYAKTLHSVSDLSTLTQDFSSLTSVQTSSTSLHGGSNWAVGDYNKDGYNEACFMESLTAGVTSTVWLKCIDRTYAVILKTNISTFATLNHIAMADFDNSKTTLGFITYNGIIYTDYTDNTSSLWWDSTLTGSSDAYPIVFLRSGASVPTAVVLPTASSGFVVSNPSITSYCNDTICQSWENAFTCPIDCLGNETVVITNGVNTGCTLDSDCASGNCEYGFCALKGQNAQCLLNSECLSGVCSNDKCTNPGFVSSMTAGKDQLFGSDTNTGNFISLFFMISVPIMILFLTRSIVGLFFAVPAFFAMAVFFTLIGWLSPFILIMAIIALVVVGVLGLIVGNAAGG